MHNYLLQANIQKIGGTRLICYDPTDDSSSANYKIESYVTSQSIDCPKNLIELYRILKSSASNFIPSFAFVKSKLISP
ncbi:hypothetical protein BAC3_01390 [uncultured bacterium]|nr:hypothetical protein BAC3_01390 [uncultured bacterium]